MDIHQLLEPPVEEAEVLDVIPELSLARGLGQGPYHHLDVFEHTMEVVRGVERELQEDLLGAHIPSERVGGLRLVGLLHDVAKPVSRGEYDGKVLFVAHDTLGARLAHRVCRRLGVSAEDTDLVVTLTALHLKIGFMRNERSDYPPPRLARAAGPFGEELAVLSWADRAAAQGPRLKQEHLDRHYDLCAEFLRISRERGPYSLPDYVNLTRGAQEDTETDAGYAASWARLLESRKPLRGGTTEYAAQKRGVNRPV
ncbi:MAG TPA: HD domain-containing protein [Rubrobacteraceae bacterium]|nr:HD domain-containing protein [Rubrobacteraceae bacterium]